MLGVIFVKFAHLVVFPRTVSHGLFYQAHYQRALQRCEDGVLSKIGLRMPSKSQATSLGSEEAFMRDVLKRQGVCCSFLFFCVGVVRRCLLTNRGTLAISCLKIPAWRQRSPSFPRGLQLVCSDTAIAYTMVHSQVFDCTNRLVPDLCASTVLRIRNCATHGLAAQPQVVEVLGLAQDFCWKGSKLRYSYEDMSRGGKW